MELNNYGLVMKFAIELEQALGKLAEEGQSLGLSAQQNETLAALAGASRKTWKLVERTRGESICEAVLGPISGLSSETFSVARPAAVGKETFGAYLLQSLALVQRFYLDAEKKLTMDEVRSVFKRIARDKDNLLASARGAFQK